ncbi:MAG: LuxR C-terminal-related transcriptional regulator [Actinomycetota bacterium]|nr:LuxR C-terminal-related transcriptional regulator [Actinomycetota bacterium]
MSLNKKDFKAILDIVHMVNDYQGELEVPQEVLSRLGSLVSCDAVGYSRADMAKGSLLGAIHEPHVTDFINLPGLHTVFHQHPGFAAYRCGHMVLGSPMALTDLADLRTLRRLPVYVDYHQPYGIKDQLLCLVHQGGQQSAVLSFNRARRGFSHRDRAAVELITPHLTLAVARRQRLASLSAAIRSVGRHHDQIDQAGPRLQLLTPREREVVEYLVGGVTDREIARSLAISPRTVHKHLETIFRKLDIGNRTSLIALIHHKR